MTNRIFFIEGLPGTGKSTISKYLSDVLLKKEINVELLLEEDTRIPSNFNKMYPVIMFMVVDFPAPLGPKKPTISPFSILKLALSTAIWGP